MIPGFGRRLVLARGNVVRGVVVVVLCVGACAGPFEPLDGDAGADGFNNIEAGFDQGLDGSGSLDAFGDETTGMDARVPCSVGGAQGVCIPVSECTGSRVPTPGFCPGPSDIQCCTERIDGGRTDGCDPSVMVIPNDVVIEEPGTGGCPPGMVRIDTFCIDRYEASLALVRPDGTLSPFSPYFNPGTRRVRALSVRGAVPQGYIHRNQAAAACREAGKRLCTDAEWLRACRGPMSTTYPYGNVRRPGVCNDYRTPHPAVEYYGSSEPWVYSMLRNACLNQLHDTVDRTGDNPGCVTAEGVYDMMGNLHEWTADPAGTFRGGYYVDTRTNGEGCLYRTTAHDATYWDYSTGFRCCADP